MLLYDKYNIEIELLEDHLCPPIPNRMNYIRYLHTLIDDQRLTSDTNNNDTLILDIGTGSTAIYPILGN